MGRILAIETSCDETAAAVVETPQHEGAPPRVVSSVVRSQVDLHALYGGVVPELAARQHLENLEPVVVEALRLATPNDATATGSLLDDARIDAIAVTRAPGLIGALLTGVMYARGLAQASDRPIIGIHHLEGHIYSALLADPPLEWPFLALLVSGAHTALYDARAPGDYVRVGTCIDDAAGEAFDKAAKLMGLAYPGGALIDKLGDVGNPEAFKFPRPLWRHGNYDFSFSGVKTAVRSQVEKLGGAAALTDPQRNDLAASLREAICDVLVFKTFEAAKHRRRKRIVVAGGVAANSRLRTMMIAAAARHGATVVFPPMQYCTDNAAMIGAAATHRFARNDFDDLYRLAAIASEPLGVGLALP